MHACFGLALVRVDAGLAAASFHFWGLRRVTWSHKKWGFLLGFCWRFLFRVYEGINW